MMGTSFIASIHSGEKKTHSWRNWQKLVTQLMSIRGDRYRVAKTHGLPDLYRSFSAQEPLFIGLFCGKWLIKIKHPMTLRHSAPHLLRRFIQHVVNVMNESCNSFVPSKSMNEWSQTVACTVWNSHSFMIVPGLIHKCAMTHSWRYHRTHL